MQEFISATPTYQLTVLAVILGLFIIQAIYWLRYKKIATHRHHHRLKSENDLPPVSVIVVIDNDPDYVYNDLPKLLTQDHPEYEVVAVNDCGGVEVTDALQALSQTCPNLKYTVINPDDRFKHSRKIPLVVGIKAAQYNNLIFTHTDTNPSSERWLSFMARGFVGADIVISYAGFETGHTLSSKIIRSSRLISSIRFLRAAISAHAYRGTMRNIGYTKELFFQKRGFTHLRLALGEDDLFIQKVATPYNTAVIINPHCTTRTTNIGNLRWWWKEQKYYTYPFKFYPFRVKFSIFTELFTRAALFTTTILTVAAAAVAIYTPLLPQDIVAYPLITLIAAASILMAREIIVLTSVKAICNRLGEKRIMVGYFIYDLLSPITESFLAISRKLKPPHGLWS